jgi:hypothetical protein
LPDEKKKQPWFIGPLDLMSLDSVFLGYIKIAVYGIVGQVDGPGTFKHRITVATKTVTTKVLYVFAVSISDSLQEVHV